MVRMAVRPALAAIMLTLFTFGTSNPPVALAAGAPDCTLASNVLCKITFSFSGAYETWTVPSWVDSITVEVSGAQGGSGGSAGGYGGKVSGQLVVRPDTNLYIFVGGQNGWNGGGAAGTGLSGNPAFVGGGASDIRESGTALINRIVVGGGGGGAGKNSCTSQQGGGGGYPGGIGGTGGGNQKGTDGGINGGGVAGTNTAGSTCTWSTFGGGGGGQNGGGGTGGYGVSNGGTGGSCGTVNSDPGIGGSTGVTAGCFGTGGAGGNMSNGGGGGGGGGWYGGGPGGGNWASGGGGGSSYLGAMTNTSYTNAFKTGNGLITITYANLVKSATTTTLSTPGSLTRNSTLALTASISQNGKVTFFANGKRIPGCISKQSNAGDVTCNWKPSGRGSISIYAAFTPNSVAYFASESPRINVVVGNRTSTR